MKVLMQNRISALSIPGGDTVQMRKTQEYLERLGIEVDINLDLEADISKYDLVHLFNLNRIHETYIQLLNAKRYNKPVVLSTVYWNNHEYESKAFTGLRKILNEYVGTEFVERMKGIHRCIVDREVNKATAALVFKGRPKLQKKVISMIDLFLPNAEMEMEILNRDFKVNLSNYRVIPNGVDGRIFNANIKLDEKFHKYIGCILCVARIDPRKNQLNLIRAVKGIGIPVVLVGTIAPSHRNYYNKLLVEKDENVTIIEGLPHEEIGQLYQAAKVHVLPSWFETPGLASLEAGACGCNLVVSDKGTTREYFKDYVSYCDPTDVESIKQAILFQYDRLKSNELARHIINNYTWEIAAKKTLKAYEFVLNGRSGRKI